MTVVAMTLIPVAVLGAGAIGFVGATAAHSSEAPPAPQPTAVAPAAPQHKAAVKPAPKRAAHPRPHANRYEARGRAIGRAHEARGRAIGQHYENMYR